MASRKPCGEPLSQGVSSPYKTNNEHYFYYQHLFLARFFVELYSQNLIKYQIKIFQRFKEIVTNKLKQVGKF
jgi:hypothetical protein